MKHVAWEADVRAPDFTPPIGMRIFTGTAEAPELETMTDAGYISVDAVKKIPFKKRIAEIANRKPKPSGDKDATTDTAGAGSEQEEQTPPETCTGPSE